MTKRLIIDGYNLIGRAGSSAPAFLGFGEDGAPRDLAGRRRRLVQLLDKAVGLLAERITVVFDGRAGPGPAEKENLAVEVLFSPGDKTADTVIEQLAFQDGPRGGVVVVTSDRLERETTGGAGAETMACSVFLDQLSETLAGIERTLRARGAARAPAAPLGNPFSSLEIRNPGANSKAWQKRGTQK